MTAMIQKGETPTAKRRKEQVLTAAVDCFRRYGFHRTSMSQISAAAGMSSGHIYHYFGSKEKIVEAIVARERSEFDLLIQDLKEAMQSTDVVTAMTDQIAATTGRYLDGDHGVLMLEILAEAARNPEIANLIQRDDEEVRTIFYKLFDGDLTGLASRGEILGALLDGLSMRAVRNPKVRDSLDMEMLRRVIRYVLTA